MIKDSGNRREFETGAVRDIADGKGRCDLLPLEIVGEILNDNILVLIERYVRTGDKQFLQRALVEFSTDYLDTTGHDMFIDVYDMLLDVSVLYEEGAKKYEERNWEKGIPLHCFIDSAVRHYLKFWRGDTDERHDRGFVWNILGAMWTQKNKPEMIDLPLQRGGFKMKEFKFIQDCLDSAQEEILAHYMAKKEHPLRALEHKDKALRALQMVQDSISKIEKEL